MIIRTLTALLLVVMLGLQALAQTPSAERTEIVTTTRSVQVETGPSVPQVVTILHGLNGLKVIRLLLRSNGQLGAIDSLDDAFKMAGEVHTNIIAGLALNDGQTIAAWLPEAEAELPPPMPPSPGTPTAVGHSAPTPATPATKVFKRFPGVGWQRLLGPADVKVVTRDGKNLVGHYVGLDGTTGLSVIQLSENALPKGSDTLVESIQPGQIVRLIGPEPVLQEGNARKTVYVRVGDTRATVVDVTRRPAQTLARVRIKSPLISSANIGAVAVNAAGTPVGIVNSVEGDEASIVPLGLVRSAVKRVMERQASVPRAWLGVRGEPIKKLQLERILKVGWEADRARALSEKQQGIFLTSVVPGSPAATAELKPGDVILSVNNELIQNAEDFSMLLQDASPGSFVNFTVARPGNPDFEAFKIKLAESPDPSFGYGFRAFAWPTTFAPIAPGLMRGTQTIALKPKVALRLGANGGLLVVYVQPNTAAFVAGLRPGDVIESINGEAVATRSPSGLLNQKETTTIVVVRDKKRLTISVPPEKK